MVSSFIDELDHFLNRYIKLLSAAHVTNKDISSQRLYVARLVRSIFHLRPNCELSRGVVALHIVERLILERFPLEAYRLLLVSPETSMRENRLLNDAIQLADDATATEPITIRC